MTSSTLIVDYLDDLLDTDSIPDYPNALNGLQLANSGQVTRIAAAVDFSLRTVVAAAESKANFLIVHHGMFWGGLKPIVGTTFTRLQTLIAHDMAVYSSHLPLDRHALYGNNALLAAELDLEPSAEFAQFKNIAIGVAGQSDIATAALASRADKFALLQVGSVRTSRVVPGRITPAWAICTGAGSVKVTLSEAHDRVIDTLV